MIMATLHNYLLRQIELREQGIDLALLAVCPNSAAVLEAAVQVAAATHAPMLFAATLNQVDRDGGYTGWTPQRFVEEMQGYAARYGCRSPLFPCLDHGGPWLKDAHTRDNLPLEQAMGEVKASLTACLQAGYSLLHIDPTVDRTLPHGEPPAIETVVARTVELIEHAESQRRLLGLPPVDYEVGTEEVHGGLVDVDNFRRFLDLLAAALDEPNLRAAWPCFVVAQVGTDLHTTFFDAATARRLTEIVRPYGSLLKGHYSDWVENPTAYPAAGMGGANVGPEFTAEEFIALQELDSRDARLSANRKLTPAGFIDALERAVDASGRWRKWLQPDEVGRPLAELSPDRRLWLVQTSARYVWAEPAVMAARRRLYGHLSLVSANPHAYVVAQVARAIEKYISAFNLYDSMSLYGA
jgi:tagatose-1,6-bisphosphate aldolase non-catalytic subunit AgaZ/GatZ